MGECNLQDGWVAGIVLGLFIRLVTVVPVVPLVVVTVYAVHGLSSVSDFLHNYKPISYKYI